MKTSVESVSARFWNDPQFAFLRNADGTVNKGLLAAQGVLILVLAADVVHLGKVFGSNTH